MSDIFDHAFDAMEDDPFNTEGQSSVSAFLNREKPDFWKCKECGRTHPLHHESCFWCKPTKRKPV